MLYQVLTQEETNHAAVYTAATAVLSTSQDQLIIRTIRDSDRLVTSVSMIICRYYILFSTDETNKYNNAYLAPCLLLMMLSIKYIISSRQQ